MSRIKRQQKLLDIIKQHEVETQEELIVILNNCGYDVTQATISRDINELKLIKVNGTQKKYRYAQVTQSKQIDNAKFLNLFKKIENETIAALRANGHIYKRLDKHECNCYKNFN